MDTKEKIIDFRERIIDFHMHPYLTAAENSCMYKEHFGLTREEARLDLERAGIGHICGSVIQPGDFSEEEGFAHIRLLNQKALELEKLFGDYYTPGFHIHPAFVKESLETLEFMQERGYRLIGELVPYMHGWKEYGMDYASRELGDILEQAGKYHMIVSYHTMNEQQEQMEEMIASHPDVIFVAAHPGQKEDFLRHLDRMKKYENACLDLSGTGLFRYGMLREGIRQVGAERFLFGTDYPITNPGMYVEAVRFEQIGETDREKVFYGNARRLLGLQE